MAEEASASVSETLGQNNAVETQPSNEATIKVAAEGGTESTCNNNNNDKAEASAVTSDGDREKTLEFADELMEKGVKAMKDSDFGEATDCFSRCLEIRLGFFTFQLPFHFLEIEPFWVSFLVSGVSACKIQRKN